MEWRNVKDKLPKEGGRYWCYVEEINDLGKSHYQWNCSYHEIEKRWSDGTAFVPVVTHWMPLPAPPTETPKQTEDVSDEDWDVLENEVWEIIMDGDISSATLMSKHIIEKIKTALNYKKK